MNDSEVRIGTELDTSQAEKQSEKLGKSLAKNIGGGAKTAIKGVAAIGTTMVAAGGVAVGSLVKMAKATAETGDHIDKMSQKIGMSAEAYQKWDYVAKISGTSIDGLKMGFKTLTNTIDKANKGNADAVDKFKQVGVSMDDLKNKSREQIFEDTIKGLQNMKDETERSALANKLLGRAGMELGPMLNSTNGDLDKLMKTAEDYGLIMSDKAVKASAKFEDSLTTMQGTFQGLKNRMMVEFLPALTEITDGFALLFKGDTKKGLDKIEKGIEELTDKIIDGIPKVLKLGGSIIKALGKGLLDNLPELLKIGENIIGSLASTIIRVLPKALPKIGELVQNIFNSIRQTVDNLKSTQLANILTSLINGIIDTLLGLLSNVPSFLEVGISFLNTLVDAILQSIPEFAKRLPEIVNGLITSILGSIDVILDGIMVLVENIISNLPSIIGSLITGIISSLPLIVEGLIKLVGKLVLKIPEILIGIISAIPSMISQFFNAITNEDNIKNFIIGFAEMNRKILEHLPEIMEVIFVKIPSMIAGFFKRLIKSIPEILTRIKDFITRIVDKLPDAAESFRKWIEGTPERIEKWLKNLPEHFYNLCKFASERGIEGIRAVGKTFDLMREAKNWMTKNLPEMLMKIAKAGNKIGMEMIKGIGNGMLGLRDWLAKKMVGVVTGTIDNVKDFLGIKSPSRLMRDEVGKMMALGMYEGFKENDPIVQIQKDLATGVGSLQNSINMQWSASSIGNAVSQAVDGLTVSVDGRTFGRIVRSY